MVVTVVKDYRSVGIRPPDFREFLQGCGPGKYLVRHRDGGDPPLDWEEPGRFPPQNVPLYGEDTPKERRDGQVDIPTFVRGNEGSGAGGGGNVRTTPQE